jgi:hypothetical protein
MAEEELHVLLSNPDVEDLHVLFSNPDMEDLYVLLSDSDVHKDIYLSTWRIKNPDKKVVEVVSVNNAGSKLEGKKLTKLALMFTKYKTTVEFEKFWYQFVNFWYQFEKTSDFSLQTLHLIFLVEEALKTENLLILKMSEFFDSLQCNTIELDCEFTVSLESRLNKRFLESLCQNRGTRVNLGPTTTSVIVRNPNARIIELRNDNPSKFCLQRIKLISKYSPMAIMLYNVHPDVIKDKNLEVYWNNLEPEILQLENYDISVKGMICIKLPQLAWSNVKPTQPVLSNVKSTQHALSNVKSTQHASLELCDCSIFDCCSGWF